MTVSELVIRLAELEDEGFHDYQVVVNLGDTFYELADFDLVTAVPDTAVDVSAVDVSDDPTGGEWVMVNALLKWPTFHLEDNAEQE